MWGLERGYCLMIGGEPDVGETARSDFATLAPGTRRYSAHAGARAAGGTAEKGYLHCGPNGAGHFVKMVHNGIEYGMMAAYAEGLNILTHANVGKTTARSTPRPRRCAIRENYQYDLNLADVAEVWRRGSVIASWLLDLTAAALVNDPQL